MRTGKLTAVSATVLALALSGPANAQLFGDSNDKTAKLADEALETLKQWQQQCDTGGQPPEGLTCEDITRAIAQQDPDAVPDQAPGVAAEAPGATPPPSTPDVTPDPDVAADQPAPAAETPDVAADAPEADVPAVAADQFAPTAKTPDIAADAPAVETPDVTSDAPAVEAPDVTSDAPAAEAPDVAADTPAVEAPDVAADTPAVVETPEPPAVAADQPAVVPTPAPSGGDAFAQSGDKPANAVPPEPDRQAQADAVAQQSDTPPAAAAAGSDDPEAGDIVDETVAEDGVRRSSEDFTTAVGDLFANGNGDKADADNDDKGLDPIAGAALLGLGAVALNQILGNNERVVTNSGDRVVIEDDQGRYRVLRNDDVLLRRPGTEVETRRFDDGSTRNILTYEDGTRVETIRAADGRVLRRVRVLQDSTSVVLFDDTAEAERVVVNDLPQVTDTPRINFRDAETETLARALEAQGVQGVNRTFSLNQVRNIDAVRLLVPEISVDTINFETNSAAIRPDEAQELSDLGNAMRDTIARNPGEVFLIEGHTDAVGNDAYNLALSDRRAESVALALTEYFNVPPENMVLQGYGESNLAVPTVEAERANRRAAVRRITPLLTQ